MAALTLKQIERGTSTFTGGSPSSLVVTLGTTLTDTTNAIILFTVESTASNAKEYNVAGRIISTTQIEFNRLAATLLTTPTVEWQVIEFTQGITVQHIYQTLTALSTDIAITAVDLAKTFPIVTVARLANPYGADDNILTEITTTTNVNCIAVNTTEVGVAIQIVQIDDASVQKFATTYGTGATKDITVTTITENKTFWLFTLGTTDVAFNPDNFMYLSYVNSTTIRFTRTDSSGINFDLVVYVVSLSSGITVQNIATTIASSGSSVSPTISTVTVANTALLLNGLTQRHASANTTTSDAGTTAFGLASLTTTAFTATRAESPATAATTNVQVLEWIISSSWVILIQEE